MIYKIGILVYNKITMSGKSPENAIRDHLYSLETQGLTTIADGRKFVLSTLGVEPTQPLLDLPTENNEPYRITVDGFGPDKVEPVSEDLPFSCHCGNLIQRSIVEHTDKWMYTVFSCSDHHLDTVYLDIFPKLYRGNKWDLTNAFMGLDTTPDLPEGVRITPLTTPDMQYGWWMEQADRSFIMSPEGIKQQARVQKLPPGWLRRILRT
jgi:hypothetical protein